MNPLTDEERAAKERAYAVKYEATSAAHVRIIAAGIKEIETTTGKTVGEVFWHDGGDGLYPSRIIFRQE